LRFAVLFSGRFEFPPEGHKANLHTLAGSFGDSFRHEEGMPLVAGVFEAADCGSRGADASGKLTLA